MGKKATYFGKHFDKLKDSNPFQGKQVNVSPEVSAQYEEGKVILIDKELHWTSFDAVKKIRGALRIKKVGHAGTLDPLATGLLIICTGKFTKKINDYMAAEKEYTGTITIGATTPTYDLESEPENFMDHSFVDEDLVNASIPQFVGDIQQFPPMYSAIKKEGTALYLLARKGEDVQLEARKIHIAKFNITKFELPVLHFQVVCGTGTYIRSLAHDLGKALGCGAYLSELRRTRIGEFPVEQAGTVSEFLSGLELATERRGEIGEIE